jgi:chromate reductase
MRILGIAGSLRRGSHNRKLLRAAALALPPEAELVEWSGLAGIPAFDEDLESGPVPPAVAELRDAIATADAVIIATPEYNASIPGALKNALDWASRPFETNVFRRKPVLVIGSSTGLFGAVWAQADVRKSLKFMKAHVLEDELPIGMADSAFALNGALLDPAAGERLAELVRTLLREVEAPVEQTA